MRRRIIILVAGLALVGVTAPAWSQAPTETPFPSPKMNIFVAAQTVTAPSSSLGVGVLTNYYAQGSTVVFRMFAGDNNTRRVLTDGDLKWAAVVIPGQPSVKLTYSTGNLQWPWTGEWKIPADFAPGIVPIKVVVKTTTKQYGGFVQIPVVTSMLTVTKA